MTIHSATALFALSRHVSIRRVLAAGSLALALLASASTVGQAHEYKVGDLEIGHPWSREPPAGAKVAAGYFTVRNNGQQADRIVGVTGDISSKAEIHEMKVDANGVMTMRALADGLEVPAGGEVALKPGSFHVMFLSLTRETKQGEKFKGSITFEKAGKIDVEFAVDAPAGKSEHEGHGG